MRQLLVPTCLFLTAWSSATGSSVVTKQIEGFSVVAKTVQASALTQDLLKPSIAPQANVSENSESPAPIVHSRVAALPAPAETADQVMLANGEDAPAAVEHPVVPVAQAPLRRAVSKDEVCDALANAASNYDLPAPFFIRLIYQESGFNSQAVSPVGAQGVAQFMPKVAASMGLDDPFDPLKALHTSAQLLRTLFQQFGNFGLAAAAYNAGPKRIQDWIAKKGPLPEETRNYVKTITGRPAEHWVNQKSVAAAQRIPARAPCQREAGLLAANGPKTIPLPPARGANKIEFASLDVSPSTLAAASPKKSIAGAPPLKPAIVVAKNAAKNATKTAAKIAVAAAKTATAKVATAVAKVATKTAAKVADKAAAKPQAGKKVRVADAGRAAK